MEKVNLKWLGTAGFHGRYRGQEFLIDPLLSRPKTARPIISARPQDFPDISLILVSHGHFDHVMDVGQLAKISSASVYAPQAACTILENEGIDPKRLHAIEDIETVTWNDVTIRFIPSKHLQFDLFIILMTILKIIRHGIFFDMVPILTKYPEGRSSEIVMDFDGYRVLFSGSGGGDWKALAKMKLQPQCLMLPFSGRWDLGDHYLKALEIMQPETVVLHHFDDFYPGFSIECPMEGFLEMVERKYPSVKVIVPEPEEWFTLP